MFRQRCQQVKGVTLAGGLVGMLLAVGLLASAAAAMQQPPLAEDRPRAMRDAAVAGAMEKTQSVTQGPVIADEWPGGEAPDDAVAEGDCDQPNNIKACRKCVDYMSCIDCCWQLAEEVYEKCKGRCQDKWQPCNNKEPEKNAEK